MLIDYLIGGAAALIVTVYIVYALLRPERF